MSKPNRAEYEYPMWRRHRDEDEKDRTREPLGRFTDPFDKRREPEMAAGEQTIMIRHRAVLERVGEDLGTIIYADKDAAPEHKEIVYLPAQLAGELGYPEKITVTVEVGDLLNERDLTMREATPEEIK